MATESRDEESLVKYDTPILVSTSSKRGDTLAPVKAPGKEKAEDYLNHILPPKEFTDKGKLWVRYVSPTPATKVDVILLKELLDKRLDLGKARDVGICPIREKLFTQCFDELTRQICINCSERGFLLFKIGDEMRNTLRLY